MDKPTLTGSPEACVTAESPDSTNTKAASDLAAHLRLALERGEFSVIYQPIVHLTTWRPMGVEALIRWDSPEFGAVSPADFIPIAEQYGLSDAIGEWVLHQACQTAKQLVRRYPERFFMSVNVSPHQLSNPKFAEVVTAVLNETHLPPKYLQLEITESTTFTNRAVALMNMKALKHQGVMFALDDFGIGNSSLADARDFPVDALKIDRRFIFGLGESQKDEAVVQAIITLANGIGLGVIAEGIESMSQVIALRKMGCSMGQGYLFLSHHL